MDPAADLLLAVFPRGPGLYFSVPKLLAIAVVALAWVKTSAWADRDSIRLNVPRGLWNVFLLVGGLAGMLLVLLIPFFIAGLFVWLVLYLAPLLAYVYQRNELLPPEQHVLTPRHFRTLIRKYLKVEMGDEPQEEAKKPPEVRFVGKGLHQRDEDPARVARAERSQGYRSAQRLVYEAVTARATDIHLEPTREQMTVRYRVDSLLRPAATFSRATGESVLNVFKVLGNLDITEKRKPQDGSFSAEVEGRSVDFRVATAGSVNGEKLVMRILDLSQQLGGLGQLGLRETMRERLMRIIEQPHGLLVVCGPTGAGKTSTLYACLGEIDRYQRNVITLENPVEYQLHNITQIEVDPKAGKTFATELRSVLRQDPDVILVGEVRDAETAEIACQAAQTGHMVFTTLHANDGVTALGRLIDLGVPPSLLANALTAVVAQRLVRLLCPACKVRYTPSPDLLRKYRLPADKVRFLYRAAEASEAGDEACAECGGSGYRGRTGVFELMVLTDSLRALIRHDPDLTAIKNEAVKGGLVLLFEDGLRKVAEGKTTLEELQRAVK